MSQSLAPLIPLQIQDPITDLDQVHYYGVYKSGQQITYKDFVSSSISTQSIKFSCIPPGSQYIVDRRVRVLIPCRITLTGTVTTTDAGFVTPTSLVNAGFDSPRQFPISSCLENLKVNINNVSVDLPLSEIIHPCMRFAGSESVREREWSTTPCMADQSANYSDLQGSGRNPLAGYGFGKGDEVEPRGSSNFIIVTNSTVVPATGGTAATCVVDCLFVEDLFISPLYFGCSSGNSNGFFNITSFDISLNFLTSANRAWSHSLAAVRTSGANEITTQITSATFQFSGFTGPAFSYAQSQPKVMFKYITPSSTDYVNPMVPMTYNYTQINRYITSIGTLTYAQGAQNFTTNCIQLNQIPTSMLIFARPTRSVLESRTDLTDTYLAIQSVQVQFMNSAVLLSTANQYQLYLINCRNGFQGSFNQFTGDLVNADDFTNARYSPGGSPLMLKFGQDIELPSEYASGLNTQCNLQVTVSLKNPNIGTQWDAIPMDLYMVIINNGTFVTNGPGSSQLYTGVLNKQDVLSAQDYPGVRANQEVGRGLWDDLGNFGSKVNQFLKDSKLISTLGSVVPLPGAPIATKIAQNLGYGNIGGCNLGSIGGMAIDKNMMRRSLADRH